MNGLSEEAQVKVAEHQRGRKAVLPGLKAQHSIITPGCVNMRGQQGAIDEAIRRVRNELEECMKGWHDKGHGDKVNLHVAVTVERL